MSDYLKVANHQFLWLSTMPVAIMVVVQAILFSRKAMKAASIVGLSNHEAKKAFRVGLTSAVGPAMGVFVVMLGLMSVIGGPLAWMRLSIIGAAPTELAAAQMAAKAQGLELTSNQYTLINFANATWVMALNGSGWLLTSGLFSDKLNLITEKVARGDTAKLGILMISAMCGAFAYLFGNQVVLGFSPEKRPYLISAIVAAVAMVLLEKGTEKHPKIKEYNLGIAMIIAMVAAVVYKHMVMGG